MRLIDADALIAEYDRVHIGPPGGARKLIDDALTIDPEELRPKGRWEIKEFPITKTKKISCSNCGYSEKRGPEWDKSCGTPRFCQSCGAKMEVT